MAISRAKLSTYEAELLESEAENIVILMPNFANLEDDQDPLFWITPDGKFNTAGYYAEYGEANPDNVKGFMLEIADCKPLIEDLNRQYQKQLKT